MTLKIINALIIPIKGKHGICFSVLSALSYCIQEEGGGGDFDEMLEN